MLLLRGRVPNEEWLQQAVSLYMEARRLGLVLRDSMRSRSIGAQVQAIDDVIKTFPQLRQALKKAGTPRSDRLRVIKKNFDIALKEYARGAELGATLLINVGQAFDEHTDTKRTARYEHVIDMAEKRLSSLDQFLSRDAQR